MYRPQLTALLLAATIPAAAQHTLRGRVLEGESPVGYATTVLLRDGRQAAGTTTDDAGGFVLTADTGRYTLVLRHVAYRPFEQEVCVAAADTDLGDLPLAPLGISEVTVTAAPVPSARETRYTTSCPGIANPCTSRGATDRAKGASGGGPPETHPDTSPPATRRPASRPTTVLDLAP